MSASAAAVRLTPAGVELRRRLRPRRSSGAPGSHGYDLRPRMRRPGRRGTASPAGHRVRSVSLAGTAGVCSL